MSKYIDVDKLIERLKFKRDTDTIDRNKYAGLECAIAQCQKAPTTDVEEVRHGEWKDRYGNKFANRHYECSVCQEPALDRAKMNSLMTAYHEQYLSPFCPHCGAKMDGERKEQNEG